MRSLLLVAAALIVACGAPQPSATGSALPNEVVVRSSVANGSVEIVVARSYPAGHEVRATVHLLPTSGTLRGPLNAIVQASAFRGTAVVRHLTVAPVTAPAGSSTAVEVVWDARSDDGVAMLAGDYSLLFDVEDSDARRTTVAATLVLRDT